MEQAARAEEEGICPCIKSTPHKPGRCVCARARAFVCAQAARAEEDSVGGLVSVLLRRVPIGLGEPCFDKLEARAREGGREGGRAGGREGGRREGGRGRGS